ncbi:MAG: hypothetical protein ACRDE5_16020 [Ginsengibacter sp.]
MKHTNTVKEGNAFTGGEWEIRDFKEDGLTIWGANNGNTCICTINEMMYNSQFPSIKSEAEANARLIAESKNLFEVVKELDNAAILFADEFTTASPEKHNSMLADIHNAHLKAKTLLSRIENNH